MHVIDFNWIFITSKNKLCICTYMCVFMCGCMCVHPCLWACMWRPTDGHFFFSVFWDRIFRWPGTHQAGRLDSRQTHPCLFRAALTSLSHLAQLFYIGSRIELKSSVARFPSWAISPAQLYVRVWLTSRLIFFLLFSTVTAQTLKH